LAEASRRDFDTRRSYEWEFNLALWNQPSQLVAGAMLKTEPPNHLSNLEWGFPTGIFAGFFVLYIYPWTRKLREWNFENTNLAEKYWSLVEVQVSKNHPEVKLRKPWDDKKPPITP
jgi:hypothetical protein